MERCEVCGRDFDPLGFQVVVPELARGFDRVDCARQARPFRAGSAAFVAQPAAAPILNPLEVRPMAAAPLAASSRRPLLVAANLGLIAAGAVASVYLWLQVFGADPRNFPLPASAAPPAFGEQTVEARIEPQRARSESAGEAARVQAAGRTTTPVADRPSGDAVLAAVTTTAPPRRSSSRALRPASGAAARPTSVSRQSKGGGKAREHVKPAKKPKTHGHHSNGKSNAHSGSGKKLGHSKKH